MTSSPISHAISFWRPLLDSHELHALATCRSPDEPLVPGINVWRTDSARRPYRVVDGGACFWLFASVHPIADPPPSATVLADIQDPDGAHYSYVLQFPDGAVVLPFDPDSATEAFRREEYVPAARRTILPGFVLSAYYSARPWLPGRAKGLLRRLTIRRAFSTPHRLLEWPYDHSLDSLQRLLLRLILVSSGRAQLDFAWFWPRRHPWAVVLTHDVETGAGLAEVPHVAEMERERGLRSSFNFVPCDYETPDSLRQTLEGDGFEVGVHGYKHDGLMFSKWSTFSKRVVTVNEIGRQWGASGFRSPATYRNFKWFSLLEFDYDSSVADTAPFEPQPGGCASCFPYAIDQLVELPVTLPQDHTLFAVLGQTNAAQWSSSLRQVRDSHGMACVLTHPDPARGYIGLAENATHYGDLLDEITRSNAWTPLPRELARWWRTRASAPLDRINSLDGVSFGTARLDTAGRLQIVPPDCPDYLPKDTPVVRKKPIRVWIDMANSPHVQFFGPIIRQIEARGHSVIITARDFAQTVELLDGAGLSYATIGRHGGKSSAGKLWAIEHRARALASYARQHGAEIAVHHNSYAQSIAAWTLRMPSVTLMDYEHQPANHVSFRLSDVVLVPESIPRRSLAPYGAGWRLRRYPGLKEDFYVATMVSACGGELGIEGLDPELPLLVLRPPPDLAMYHRLENALWNPLLGYLSSQPGIEVLVLPRTEEQAVRLAEQASDRVRIATHSIDPAALLRHADGIITAGGTMAREAAALGIPAYTVFAGRRGGVDANLIGEGRLVELSSVEDFERISLRKCERHSVTSIARERERVDWLVDIILATAGG